TAQPGGVGDADCVQELGGQGGGLGRDPLLVGVVPGVPVALEQGEDLHGVDTAGDGGGGVAVGGKEPVAFGEREGGAGLTCLLPVGGGVDGELALSDQRTGLVVDTAADHQGLVRGEQPVRSWERQDRVLHSATRR